MRARARRYNDNLAGDKWSNLFERLNETAKIRQTNPKTNDNKYEQTHTNTNKYINNHKKRKVHDLIAEIDCDAQLEPTLRNARLRASTKNSFFKNLKT